MNREGEAGRGPASPEAAPGGPRVLPRSAHARFWLAGSGTGALRAELLAPASAIFSPKNISARYRREVILLWLANSFLFELFLLRGNSFNTGLREGRR